MNGKKVRERREAIGMTQEEFAEKAGISQSMVSLIETGRRDVLSATLFCIANALGVKADDLQ